VAGQVAELRRPITNEHPATAIEYLDAKQLGQRLNLPASWLLENTRSRAVDPVPCLRFGKYVRFAWGSRELAAWLGRRTAGKRSE